MKKCKIFFSWASENIENKKYIKKVLNLTQKRLKKEAIELKIIQATSNYKGFIDISAAIRKNIENCDYFIADLSIIGDILIKNKINKKTPNVNVCYELGLMMGRKCEDRIFAMYNINCEENASKNLPFDFSHNRVIEFSLDDNEEKYSDIIANSIIHFDKMASLESLKPLKKHDKNLNDYISSNMENFKFLVNNNIECYLSDDIDFVFSFQNEMTKSINRFSNSSLESKRIKLVKSLSVFINYLSIYTNKYSETIYKCTILFFYKNYYDGSDKYLGFKKIKLSGEKNNLMKKIKTESTKYVESAFSCINSFEDLENTFITLSE